MYRPIVLPHFRKQLKRHLKKYRDLKQAIFVVLENFDKRQADSLGANIYKIRFTTKSLARGKSKSFRLIVLIMEIEKYLIPITFYFKGDKTDITEKEINQHLENILIELDLLDVLNR